MIRPVHARRLLTEQREHALDNDEDPSVCACGNPPLCIGQYEGEVYPHLGCAACCKHEDHGPQGRCYVLEDLAEELEAADQWTAGKSKTPERAGCDVEQLARAEILAVIEDRHRQLQERGES